MLITIAPPPSAAPPRGAASPTPSIRSNATCFAFASREGETSVAFMDAERSITMTVRWPFSTLPRIVGCANANNNAAKTSSCSRSNRFRLIRWNGALACRSWIALRQSSVELIATRRRLRLRKYIATNTGMVIPAAIRAAMGVRKVMVVKRRSYQATERRREGPSRGESRQPLCLRFCPFVAPSLGRLVASSSQ